MTTVEPIDCQGYRPLRIAIPIHSFDPGGVERVALRLAAEWQENGAEVTIVLGRADGRGRVLKADKLRFHSDRSFVPTARFEMLWMIICFYRYLRREQVDIVFCPGNTYTGVCAAMRLLLGRRTPPIVAKISNDLLRMDLPALLRMAYHAWVRAHALFISRFVAIAEPMAPEVVKQVGVEHVRVTVVPDPAITEAERIRLAARPFRRCPKDGAVIVSVGRLVRQKNYPLLLRAFAGHAAPLDRLIIAGEGPEMVQLKKLTARLGIDDRVTFTGHCDDVPALFETADVFALSSAYEGVPAVLIEALAAGMPIVATNCSASIEWLTSFGSGGIMVPAGDVDRFGHALRDIRDLPMPSQRGRLRAARFTIERAAQAYLRLFEAEIGSLRRLAEVPPCTLTSTVQKDRTATSHSSPAQFG